MYQTEIAPNTRASFLKRILASLFDTGILFLFYFIGYLGLMKTPIADTYYQHQDAINEIIDQTLLDNNVGVIHYVTEETDKTGKIIHIDGDGNEYYVSIKEDATKEDKQAYNLAIKNNQILKDERFGLSVQNYAISAISFGVFELIFFLIIPICSKQKATCGQMIFKMTLYSRRQEEKAKWYHCLGRFFLVLLFESGLSFLWLENLAFIAMPVVNLIICLLNPNRNTLRDLISNTRFIETRSYQEDVED